MPRKGSDFASGRLVSSENSESIVVIVIGAGIFNFAKYRYLEVEQFDFYFGIVE